MEESNPTNAQKELESLITNTLDTLRKASEIDVPLLDILATHIVRIDSAKTAVDDASKAIEALAKKRVEENG